MRKVPKVTKNAVVLIAAALLNILTFVLGTCLEYVIVQVTKYTMQQEN